MAEVAYIADRSLATVRRWEHQNDAPRFLWWLLYCCAGHVLDKEFYGFRIQDGKLWTGTRITHNHGFSRQEITNYGFFREYTRTLERDLVRVRAQVTKTQIPVPVSNVIPFNKSLSYKK